jgi:Zn-dependent protease
MDMNTNPSSFTSPTPSDVSPSVTQYPGVMMEIKNLQNAKSSWGGAIFLLVLSVILFVGAESREQSWEYLLILLGVLFFHEMGHYLSMRIFKYRNLRMFFIPFFGAAVSGQHYTAPGWKKVIVSLMGPLPGIVLGVPLGIAGLMLHQDLITRIAIMLLFLNGFNLLPIFPFDGGRIFQTLLFCRHHVLDTLFRFAAVIGLIALAIMIPIPVLGVLGLVMLLSLPAVFSMARIAQKLRREGFDNITANEEEISDATADVIIGEIKTTKFKDLKDKTMAQHTLQVYETLNARPPSWLATLGFLVVHVGAFVIAVIFAIVFYVGNNPALKEKFLEGMREADRNARLERLAHPSPQASSTVQFKQQ